MDINTPILLGKDESVLWEGHPNPRILFSKLDRICILLSMGFLGMFIFLVSPLDKLFGFLFHFSTIEAIVPTIIIIALLLLCLYQLLGRFIYKYFLLQQTRYFVTDKRIIIMQKKHTLSCRFYEIDQMYKKDNSIYFSPPEKDFLGIRLYREMLRFYRVKSGKMTFQNIQSAEDVYELIYRLKEPMDRCRD